MSLLDAEPIYKPFHYPWAYDAWLTQQRIHWLPEEVPLADDVKDWRHKLSDGERNLLTQIFRFFTQADVEVTNCYMRHYGGVFKPTEVQMMLSAFSNIETVHISAYSHLLDTLGMGAPRPASRLAALLARIELDPGLPWTTETMARAANLSVSRLHALFREELDASPHGWLLDCRLKRACTLLGATDRPVAEIALATGFSEQSALTRAMRRMLDTTPAAYRAQHREKRSKAQ